MRRIRRARGIAVLLPPFVLIACTPAGPTTYTHIAGATTVAPTSPPPAPAVAPSPLPGYAIDALRARPRAPVKLVVGASLARGSGYTKRAMTWQSMGSTMTGVLDIPDGSGPFPVVVVNHGYVPESQYYVGQDSSKYADPMASAGFVTASPNYPGYAGSGPAPPELPSIVGQAIADMDLITALATLPQADMHRVAVAGHSNGGGVALILLASDDRVRAVVLYAPVSSNMIDNARRLWADPNATGGLPNPFDDPSRYALFSPRHHLPPGGAPTLLMQGSHDEDIPEAWTTSTYEALKDAGIRTEFVSFPGAMHNFRGPDLVRANGLAIDWIRAAVGA